MKITIRSRIFTIDNGLIFVVALGILIRMFFFNHYAPYSFNDTEGYKNLALQIKTLDFTNYDAARTPAFPLLIVLSGFDDRTLWLYQSLIGILISIMLYTIALVGSGNKKIATVAGLSYSLCLNLLFFEANILTETVSIFLLVLSFLLVIYAVQSNRLTYFILNGIIISVAILTRPLFLCLIPVQLLFLTVYWKKADRKKNVRAIASYLLPVVLLVGGWCTVNKIVVDYFGVTTFTGYNLLHHSESLIQYAPEEFSGIRDAYLKDSTKSMWFKIGEMRRASGLSFGQLSSTLTKMSLLLFISHPIGYLKDVGDAWIGFWDAVIYWNIYSIQPRSVMPSVLVVWKIERVFLICVNIIFIASGFWSLYLYFFRKLSNLWFSAFLFASIIVASVFQALIEYGENARYAIPFQPLIFVSVMVFWGVAYRTKYFKNM